jgi:predicted small secreted protein
MKRAAVLLALVLGCAVSAAANTIYLNRGFGTLTPNEFLGSYFFSFGDGAGHGVSIPTLDIPSGFLAQCLPFCDPTAVKPNTTLLFDEGTVFMDDGGVQGHIQFDALYFKSSLNASGMLSVVYTATADIHLQRCLSEFPICSVLGTSYVWGNPSQPWYVRAQFAPAPSFPGLYYLIGATFSTSPAPIPEPTSILLVGSGLVAIVVRKLRQYER